MTAVRPPIEEIVEKSGSDNATLGGCRLHHLQGYQAVPWSATPESCSPEAPTDLAKHMWSTAVVGNYIPRRGRDAGAPYFAEISAFARLRPNTGE
jgi:hypothetical protein